MGWVGYLKMVNNFQVSFLAEFLMVLEPFLTLTKRRKAIKREFFVSFSNKVITQKLEKITS
jgi:hypothetical protein